MADTSSQDKTLPASQRKLDKAREEGQVARSRDLGHFIALATGGAIFAAALPKVAGAMRDALAHALSFGRLELAAPDSMLPRLFDAAVQLLWLVVPFGALLAFVAIAGSVAMGGWTWTAKPLEPKFSVLDPIAGMGRVFSKALLIDALKASFLALLLGAIGSVYLREHVELFAGLLTLPLASAIAEGGTAMLGGLGFLVLALAVFAAIDVPLQKRLHADKLKMSHQEVKQEQKELEGNREIKTKVRTRMREMTRRRMMAAVPKADLVVMNPTHYAVALKYDEASMGAPRVTAKGADLLALRIRDLAKGSAVPVLDAPVLARALYAHAEIDREIPAALFAAVAQVLAYVYQLRAAFAGSAPMPGTLPELEVPRGLDPHDVGSSAGMSLPDESPVRPI